MKKAIKTLAVVTLAFMPLPASGSKILCRLCAKVVFRPDAPRREAHIDTGRFVRPQWLRINRDIECPIFLQIALCLPVGIGYDFASFSLCILL